MKRVSRFLLVLFSLPLVAATLQNPNFTFVYYSATPTGQAGFEPEVTAINNNNVEAGDTFTYLIPGVQQLGLIYNPDETYSTFALPSLYYGPSPVKAINDNGVVAGVYFDSSIDNTSGFVGRPGELTTFRVPGAIETLPRALNDAGVVVGGYYDANNVQHGFISTANGTFTTVDAPGSSSTSLSGINNAGQIVGEGFGYGGFLYSNNAFTSFFGGSPLGINDSGAIFIIGYHGLDILFPNGDLANIITSNLNPNQAFQPFGFNNEGVIAGGSVILTPVPEPGSFTLALGALSIGMLCGCYKLVRT